MKLFLILAAFCILCTTQSAQAKYNRNSANENDYAQHHHPSRGINPRQILERDQFDLAEYLLSTCPKLPPINYRALRKADTCLHNFMDGLNLKQLVLLVVTQQFDQLSTKVCSLWPALNNCMHYLINYMQRCHDNKYIGKIAEDVFKYACSSSKHEMQGQSNLLDFLTSDGLSCGNVGKFTTCLKHRFDNTADICTMITTVKHCGEKAFEDCRLQKSWGILSRGVEYIRKDLKCDVVE